MSKKNNSFQQKTCLILDFGSQYTWLVARCFRELGFYSRVEPFDFALTKIQNLKPWGIVLSGGPCSTFSSKAPARDLKELLTIAPIMGICYGFQLLCKQWGGEITPAKEYRNYGKTFIHWVLDHDGNHPLSLQTMPQPENADRTSPAAVRRPVRVTDCRFAQSLQTMPQPEKKVYPIPAAVRRSSQAVWMSHGDFVSNVPKEFSVLAKTKKGMPVAFWAKNIFAVQFHPEVSHTENGKNILSYFANNICYAKKGGWNADSMLSTISKQVTNTLKGDSKTKNPNVLCALSGGVDSTVMACLLTKILGPASIQCVFVDTGLLRQNEFQEILDSYKKMGLNVKGLKKERQFLSALSGVTDPEQKRKFIGKLFIDIFKELKVTNTDLKYLAQGTLYPDVIESQSVKGPSDVIKSHHNVGGLPKNLPFTLLEPLRMLFKDEVRTLGKKLKIKSHILNRHPFPGPGLAVRICGEITNSRLQKLKQADYIFIEELKSADLYNKIWQAFAVLLPVRSVGVQGDGRTYDEAIALRAITSTDGMTADWFAFPPEFLHKVSDRITNEVKGINRVVYDISSKPPATIEWL